VASRSDHVGLGVAAVTRSPFCVQVSPQRRDGARINCTLSISMSTSVVWHRYPLPLPPCAKPGDTRRRILGVLTVSFRFCIFGAGHVDGSMPTMIIVRSRRKNSIVRRRIICNRFAKFQTNTIRFLQSDNPMLFSPAWSTIPHWFRRTWRSGVIAPEILRASFGLEST